MKIHELEWIDGNKYFMKIYDSITEIGSKEVVKIKNGDLFHPHEECELPILDVYKMKDVVIAIFEEYIEPVDWSNVKVDTKVFVRNSEMAEWEKKHFSHCSEDQTNGIYCFTDGGTSFTRINEHVCRWKYAKLAKEDK